MKCFAAIQWVAEVGSKSHGNVSELTVLLSCTATLVDMWNYTDVCRSSCSLRIDRIGIWILPCALHTECILFVNRFYVSVVFYSVFRSQSDLGAGQSAARSWVSHLVHQPWLGIHHFILRVLIGFNSRDQLPTLLHQWRSVVRTDTSIFSPWILLTDLRAR